MWFILFVNMKTKTILYLAIGILFLATFFLDIIPIKVVEVSTNIDLPRTYKTLWFSGMELNSDNPLSSVVHLSFFIIMAGGNYLIKW